MEKPWIVVRGAGDFGGGQGGQIPFLKFIVVASGDDAAPVGQVREARSRNVEREFSCAVNDFKGIAFRAD